MLSPEEIEYQAAKFVEWWLRSGGTFARWAESKDFSAEERSRLLEELRAKSTKRHTEAA